MNGPRRNLYDRIAEEQKRHEESRAALADLKARARELDRKLDVRRKIILGAAVQAHAKLNGRFREELRKAVLAAITRPQDRAVLPEFFPDPPAAPLPPARPQKPPGDPSSGAAPA
jgi:hypothetical protein